MAKICFISAGLSGGGMERAFSGLANHFAEKGHEVSAILLFKTDHFFTLHPDIKILEPDIDRKKVNKFVYAVRLIPFIRRNIKHLNPDTIISFGEWFNPYVILATRGLGCRLYVSDRMGPDLSLGLLLDISKKILYRFADGVIAQTHYAAQRIKEKTGVRYVQVIPNPLNPIKCHPNLSRENQIVSVGRLSREKGHCFLIEAFSKLVHQDWTLQLVGDGPERQSLEALAASLGLKERVVFHGHVKDFSSILAESNIFVLPSLYEGFPNALIEAMSVRLACISSNCNAGPSDIIEDKENGLLVPPGDADALAAGISLLITDEQLRNTLADNAEAIIDTLNFDKIADQYLNFILPNSFFNEASSN